MFDRARRSCIPGASLTSNPLILFALSCLLAWIYVIIPSESFWIYALVKNQWWALLSVFVSVEIEDVSLPDTSDNVYIMSYVLGLATSPILRLVGYALAMPNNFYVNVFAVSFTVVTPVVLYTIHGYHKHRQQSPSKTVLSDPFSDSRTASQNAQQHGGVAMWATLSPETHTRNQGVVAPVEMSMNDHWNLPPTISAISLMASARIRLSIASSETKVSELVAGMDQGQAIPDHRTSFSPSPSPSPSLMFGLDDISSHSDRSTLDRPLVSKDATSPNVTADVIGPSAGPSLLVMCWLAFLLPRYHFSEARGVMVNIGRRHNQVLWAALFNLCFSIFYYFVAFFTSYFLRRTAHQSTNQSLERVTFFLVYMCVCTVLRTAMKRLGLAIDKNKEGTVSMFFMGEVLGLYFYYSFYRVLFESVNNLGEFFIFQALHLSSEWILYPLRASRILYTFADSLQGTWGSRVMSLFVEPDLTFEDWQHFVCLDFAIRCVVMLSTGPSVLLLLATMDFVPWVGEGVQMAVKEDRRAFAQTVLYIGLAVLFEAVNAFFINLLFFQEQNLSIFTAARGCFSNTKFSFMCVAVGAIILINSVEAFSVRVASD